MAEVNRVMEQIGRQCEHAQIIMGAAVDAEMKNKLSVTVIAARNSAAVSPEMPPAQTACHGAARTSAHRRYCSSANS